MQQVDLHTHSTKSDGTYTPAELMDYAVTKNLSAIALTDHDTTDGIDEALAHIRKNNLPLELIPGIEFSTRYMLSDGTGDQEVHVVGLFVDHKCKALVDHVKDFVDSRIERNHRMCRLLTEAGMPVTYEELKQEFPGAVITRAHYGRFLLNHHHVATIKEAFEKYIGEGCPCYVPRRKVTPFDVVHIILEAGGVPVLAHPMLYHLQEQELRILVERMKAEGAVGIEAIYPTYTEEEEQLVRRLAKEFDLCISGGSDFHGAHKPGLDLAVGYGKLYVPDEVLENLRVHMPDYRNGCRPFSHCKRTEKHKT